MTAAPPSFAVSAEVTPARHQPVWGLLSWLQAPLMALQFLTVLPPLVRRPPQSADLGRSEAFFPLVGLVLGVTLAGIDVVLTPVIAPLIRDVLILAVLAVLTGALHLDGVIDTFDGLFAGASPSRRLEIMRDPRAGSYGVVAVVLVIALKLAALVSLPANLRTTALIIAPCIGRWGIVLSTGVFAYARPEGMGRAFKDAIRWIHVAAAASIALSAAGILAGVEGVLIWSGVSVAVLLAGRWIARRLGGLSGDCYGAICEISEAGVLVAFGIQIGSGLG